MSNTGRSKRLASFNCNAKLWEDFMQRCQKDGTTATSVLTVFISHYLNNSLDELAVSLGKMTAKGKGDWEQQVKALVETYLEQCLPEYLDKYALSQPASGSSRKSTLAKPEKEFWFVRERAKYLDIQITANQIIHIEMHANDAYKERYGTLPKRQLFKGTQSFVYPKQDLDLLDAAIKKVSSW